MGLEDAGRLVAEAAAARRGVAAFNMITLCSPARCATSSLGIWIWWIPGGICPTPGRQWPTWSPITVGYSPRRETDRSDGSETRRDTKPHRRRARPRH